MLGSFRRSLCISSVQHPRAPRFQKESIHRISIAASTVGSSKGHLEQRGQMFSGQWLYSIYKISLQRHREIKRECRRRRKFQSTKMEISFLPIIYFFLAKTLIIDCFSQCICNIIILQRIKNKVALIEICSLFFLMKIRI